MYDPILKFIFAVLIFISPVCAFIGVNTKSFSKKQIISSISLSLILGAFLGVVFLKIPSFISCIIGFTIFLCLSERCISTFKLKNNIVFYFIIVFLLFFTIFSYFYGIMLPCTVVSVYFIFSLYDIVISWNNPKDNIFSIKNFTCASDYIVNNNFKNINFLDKPNIYFLFLESMHSSEALKKVYNISDGGLEEYLASNQFNIFRDTFSNECQTHTSLNTILNMDPYNNSVSRYIPELFWHLKNNMYDIQVFDSILYVFQGYIKYVNYHNLSIPKPIAFIYEYLLPFFLQSKFLLLITRNIDPFSSSANYEKIRQSFFKKISINYKNPQAFFIRFGAEHSPPLGYDWNHSESFKDIYQDLYLKAVDQIKDIVALINKYDKKSIIIALGDHGSYLYRNAWKSNSKSRINYDVMTYDVAGILCAIKMHTNEKFKNITISPCNIFRLIFSILCKKNPKLQFQIEHPVGYSSFMA